MTDRTASRWAWIIFSVNTLFVLAALAFSSLNGSGRNPWSSSEILSNALYALAMFSFPVVVC